ncbi:DUF7860 family protein [Halococcoides cellulosivorans]|uniref:Uncharacterized protein n=1 Tax=Halococcoides cellulosivorans TaxID=1679096 RepID=A0A2R4X076_9EURY|nr:hypothetical protein [Halococcoides cellulosivorans]AWB27202.1 hypothetical protein HARCEL1_05540 [Halococcoides cellulosivorans]
MATHSSMAYGRWTRLGFATGALLFVVGVLGHLAVPAFTGPAPDWVGTLLFDMEVLGVLIALFVPLLFGIVLPLTE